MDSRKVNGQGSGQGRPERGGRNSQWLQADGERWREIEYGARWLGGGACRHQPRSPDQSTAPGTVIARRPERRYDDTPNAIVARHWLHIDPIPPEGLLAAPVVKSRWMPSCGSNQRTHRNPRERSATSYRVSRSNGSECRPGFHADSTGDSRDHRHREFHRCAEPGIFAENPRISRNSRGTAKVALARRDSLAATASGPFEPIHLLVNIFTA